MVFQESHKHKQAHLECACGSHSLRLSFFPEDEHEKWAAYLIVEIQRLSFWLRLKWGLKIILGQTREWEQFIIDNEYTWKKFKIFVDEIEKELSTEKKK